MSQTTLYASALAKIGAERSQLLSETKQKALTETHSLTEFVAQLQDTTYKEQIAKISQPITSRKLERAFKENQIVTAIKIIKNSPKTSADFLRLQILKFEVENIKVLIKTSMGKLSREQKLDKLFLSVEDFLKRRSVFEEAAGATELKQIFSAFNKTKYAHPLKMGLDSYEENGATTCLDVLLDKEYYEKLCFAYQALPKKEKAHANFYVSMDNDGYVLLALLRGKNLNYDANWLRLVVPPKRFDLSDEKVEAMVMAEDFDSALKIAQQTHYGKFFVKAQMPEETVANAEAAFERAVFSHAKESRLTELFNVGAALAFLVQKVVEVDNLVVDSLGVEAGLEPQDIQRQMLF